LERPLVEKPALKSEFPRFVNGNVSGEIYLQTGPETFIQLTGNNAGWAGFVYYTPFPPGTKLTFKV